MDIAIINYGSGNIRSAAKAFEQVISAESEKRSVRVTDEAKYLSQASHIVLPGVGAFGDCMNGLEKLPGMREELERSVIKNGKPFLGICVGMQLLASIGKEYGSHEGLGWIDSEVLQLQPSDNSLKVPHMGWNNLSININHPILKGISSGDHMYFVHSFYMNCKNKNNILATTNHGQDMAAIVAKENILGVQFHPEKSQSKGLQFIKNFVQWFP